MKDEEINKAVELFGEKLDSSLFEWTNYCGTKGVSLLNVFKDAEVTDRFIVEGWCDASDLSVRPRSSGIAIMLYDKKSDNDKVWIHVSGAYLDTLYLSKQLHQNDK